MNKTMRTLILPGLLITMALAIAAGLIANPARIESSSTEQAHTSVRVQNISETSLRLNVYSEGTVIPRNESDLVPEVAGRVTWVSPALLSGGSIVEGESLLRIDQRDYQTALVRARAQLERAQSDSEHAQTELQRQVDLDKRQLTSRSSLDQARRDANRSKAVLLDAKAALQQAERNLARTELRAPFTGRVRSEQVDVGQFLNRGAAIASLYATDFLEVRLPIADSQLQYLALPHNARNPTDSIKPPEVTLSAEFAGQHLVWQGSIVRSEAEIDKRSRMVHLIARIDSDSQDTPLPVGLFVEAKIEGRVVKNVLRVSRKSLRNQRLLIVDHEDRHRR